jgi:hypothetical protein
MPTFCECPDVHICKYKKQVGKVLTVCTIDADKEKCCYSIAAEDLIEKIKEIE